MQCLLDLLRGQIADRLVDDAEWEEALALAEQEHLLPWAAACLRSRQRPLAPGIASRVEKIERDAAIAAFYWTSELKGVLGALGAEEIAAVPLKGPFLAERLYGSAALRVSVDLDVLVAKADLSRAEDVLSAAGFAPGAADDYHRPWRRETTVVELHHDVENPLAFDFHVESALRRTRAAEFQRVRCWRLAPEDELLFLCLHGVRHRFERMNLIVDLQLGFEKLAGGAHAWQPRAEVAGLGGLLTLGLAMARRLQPDLAVGVDFAGPKRQKEHLEKLADRLWHRLLTQSSDPLDWRAVHGFFLEMELPGWPRLYRRYRHVQILAGRVIEPDYAFAARFGMRRDWQARMLRPVRLLAGFRRP
jgi:hypothetical protein